MDLSKSYEFFQPEKLDGRVHIIGCGSVGSTVAENLARFGVTKMTLYDFDVVESKNLANQMFVTEDIGRPKVDAVKRIILSINPEAEPDIKKEVNGYVKQRLSGYVFLAVDNIDLRRNIATAQKDNSSIKGMFDFRTGLLTAQHYAAEWGDAKSVMDFINTMQFSHEEAEKETPMSACHVTLSVAPTVRIISALGVQNFINFAKTGKLKKMVLIDTEQFTLDAF